MDQTLTTPWSNGQKIGFRFAFLFFSLTTIINWALVLFFAGLGLTKKSFPLEKVFSWMASPFYWLDRHVFRTGYDPKVHDAWPQDNHFAIVFYLVLFLFSGLGVVIWSTAQKDKRNYDTLSYWFNLYLRYTLAITIIGYGIDKIIPVQMPWPTAAAMLSNYGEQDRFTVLWRFMGVSPGYSILTGSCEVVAGVLLLSRRTLLVGYLFLLTILVNVVALNWFYNVSVKMYSAQLLLYNLYLLAPYSKRLVQFFFFDRVGAATRAPYVYRSRRRVTVVLILIPLLLCLLTAVADYKRYGEDTARRKSQKCYNVTSFVTRDTLPPLLTDTLRWKRLLVYGDRVLVCNMTDGQDHYTCDVDSGKGTFTFHDNPDKTTWNLFHYSYPRKDQLQLVGKWKGQDIQVTMQSFPIDSMALNKEQIHLIQD